MLNHEILKPFSSLWWEATLISTAFIAAIIWMFKNSNPEMRNFGRISLGIVLILLALLIHPYLFFLGKWSVQSSLPLHLCTFSGLLAGFIMIWPNKPGFEFLAYWGIPGGFHSILTPEFVHSSQGFLFIEYYMLHGGIILAPLFLSIVHDMKLRSGSWLKTFLWTQLAIPVVGTINWILGSNYMYLAEKPVADNPFIIGDWPWYILILEAACLIHFFIIYKLLTKEAKLIVADPAY